MIQQATELPHALAPTRETLHRIAVHVLGRRRYQVSGRFGLRACPGGMATPAFGDGPESLRVADGVLIREIGGAAAYQPISGSTMRALATFAGTDATTEFSVGGDTPLLGDIDQPLDLDVDAAGFLGDWYALAWRVLDQGLAALTSVAERATIQLWPEHFDAGTNVVLASGSELNLGASPGDSTIDQPYLYVGPRGSERPGDPRYWNAPFGAALPWSDLQGNTDPLDTGIRFVRTGLRMMAGEES